MYYPTRPLYATWEVSPGVYRRIYIPSDNHTLYVFYPEANFTLFGFTVKDLAGVTGRGNVYFTTQRTINGTTHTVESVLVENTINSIPATLVINRNYFISILVGDEFTQTSSFLSNTLDLTPTVVISRIEFSRAVQISNKWLYVDADRPTATSLRVNYTNTRGDTNSVTVNIRYLNGTLVNTTVFTTDVFTFTYSPVDNETTYQFDLDIDTDWITTEWKKVLPWTPGWDAPPDLGVIGSFGGVNTNYLLGFFLIAGAAYLFSGRDVAIACFTTLVVAALASYYGLFPLNAAAVGLMVLVAIGGAIAYRGR